MFVLAALRASMPSVCYRNATDWDQCHSGAKASNVHSMQSMPIANLADERTDDQVNVALLCMRVMRTGNQHSTAQYSPVTRTRGMT